MATSTNTDHHGITLIEVHGTSTQSSADVTYSDEPTSDHWYVAVVIAVGLLVHMLRYFIKRQCDMKAREKREKEYLEYFHSVLPQSQLYGLIPTPGEGSTTGGLQSLRTSLRKLSIRRKKSTPTTVNEHTPLTAVISEPITSTTIIEDSLEMSDVTAEIACEVHSDQGSTTITIDAAEETRHDTDALEDLAIEHQEETLPVITLTSKTETSETETNKTETSKTETSKTKSLQKLYVTWL